MTVAPLPDLSAHLFAITGATGFLGRHVIALLKRQGAQIIALRRPGSRPLDDERIAQHEIDFSNEQACAATLGAIQPTQLIHLAGYANTERSIASIAQALQFNLNASINLILGAMDQTPNCRVILPGSLENASPWREPLSLGSAYGMSKAMVEVLSGSLNQLYNANVINLRIGMAYGENDPNRRRIIPSVIEAFLAGRSPQISSGARLCDWIHAEDVAEALIRAALLPEARPANLDIGWGKLDSIATVVDTIRDIMGIDIQPSIAPHLARPNEQARFADIETASAALDGWRPRITLREGLARTIAGYREQLAA